METPSSTPIHHVSSGVDLADQPLPGSPTSTDGWGEIENGLHEDHDSDQDGWDDIEPLEEPKPSPALANIQAAQKRPVSQPVLHPVPQTKPPGNILPILLLTCIYIHKVQVISVRKCILYVCLKNAGQGYYF